VYKKKLKQTIKTSVSSKSGIVGSRSAKIVQIEPESL